MPTTPTVYACYFCYAYKGHTAYNPHDEYNTQGLLTPAIHIIHTITIALTAAIRPTNPRNVYNTHKHYCPGGYLKAY
jgi:hypothetical protein